MDIWSLADVKKAIENPDGNFCMINFMYLDWPLIIDLEKGQTRHNAILQQYQVPADARISDAN